MKMMKTTLLMLTITLATLAPLAVAFESAGGGDDSACNNYGIQQQITVVGNNTYKCQAQQCVNGGAGAGSAGVGVGTAGGSGSAGASASAGTGCKQSSGGGDGGKVADLLALESTAQAL